MAQRMVFLMIAARSSKNSIVEAHGSMHVVMINLTGLSSL